MVMKMNEGLEVLTETFESWKNLSDAVSTREGFESVNKYDCNWCNTGCSGCAGCGDSTYVPKDHLPLREIERAESKPHYACQGCDGCNGCNGCE